MEVLQVQGNSVSEQLWRSALVALKPPPDISVNDWAEQKRRFTDGPEPGRWHSRPFQVAPQQAMSDEEVDAVIYVAASQGGGKALALDTPIATPEGWTSMGEIRVGDRVFDDKGETTSVVATSPVMTDRKCFAIQFDDGSRIIADADHRWEVIPQEYPRQPRILSTSEIARYGGDNLRVRVAAALSLPQADLPIDAYVLGVYLGDGSKASGQITADLRDSVYDELV